MQVFILILLFALEASAVGQSEELPTSSLENDAESSVVMQADHVSCDSAQSTPRSLLDIRPLPKAGPRTAKITRRKRGRTRILTDTPEKNLIEQEATERKVAKAKQASVSETATRSKSNIVTSKRKVNRKINKKN